MKKSKIFKSIIIIIAIMMIEVKINAQNVGIGSTSFTPDASAVLEVKSTDKGVLIPRLTSSQRDLITNPAEYLIIFNVSTKCFQIYCSGMWQNVWCSPTKSTENIEIKEEVIE